MANPLRKKTLHVPRHDLLKRGILNYIVVVLSVDRERLMGLMPRQDRQWGEGTMTSIVQSAVQEAVQEGKAEFLLKLLERRFGELPGHVAAQVRAAGVEDIEGWYDDALGAGSLDAVFRSGASR